MAENLRHAIRGVVMASFDEHIDKRATKAAGEGFGTIFSHTSKRDFLDKATYFAKWMKETHPEVRKLDQLEKAHAQEFMDTKSAGWSQATCDTWRSDLIKLGQCISARTRTTVNLRTDRVVGERPPRADRGATSVMSKEDYSALIRHCLEHPSGSAVAILVQESTGARVGDTCYGTGIVTSMDVEGDRLRIRGKHGKVIYRDIKPLLREVLRDERFAPYRDLSKLPKDDSVNKYLKRYQAARGLERHSMHDIRRRIAQDHYDAFRESGMSRTEALQAVSVWLSHGPEREKDILKHYVGNAW